MSATMIPCFACGQELRAVVEGGDNQPSEGTEFRTYGHYGSTFWDSFHGEELVLNICDECLRSHQDRLARHKRWVPITCQRVLVGRQWVEREMVPYFDGPEDEDAIEIDPIDIGDLPGLSHIEWPENWESLQNSFDESHH